jgi:zinc-ribbon domain
VTPAAPFTSRCRSCGQEISPEAPSCPHCGAQNLEERCPHCGAVTTSSTDKELRYKCDLCGGPRVPRLSPKLRGGKTRRDVPFLKRANDARKSRAKYRAVATIAGVMGLGSVALSALWLLIFPATLPFLVTAELFVGTALFLVLWAIARAGGKTKEIAPQIDQAWQRAAADAAAAMKAPFTAAMLADAMGIEESVAEELLAHLDVSDVLRSDVTEAGEIAYQPKFRVDAAGPEASEAAAEIEALAEAEASEQGGAKAAK